MNPWGIIVIACGIVMIYIGVKGNPHAVVSGLKSAYSQVPGTTTSATSTPPTSGNTGAANTGQQLA